MNRLLFTGAVLILFLLHAAAIPAQTYELRGSVREWIKNYIHPPQERGLMESRIELELISSLGERSAFRVQSYYVYDGLAKSGEWDLHEAYIDLYLKHADIRFGKQIVAWGKADELNPTDVLNPQRYQNFTEEKNIRKMGLTMVKSDIFFGDNTLSLVWKPEFDYFRFPTGNPRISAVPFPGTGALDPEMPANELDKTEWAVKYLRTFGLYDISLSYFDGWDNIFSPEFAIDPGTQQPFLQRLIFHRTKMFGADFAGSLRTFGVWGEFAYFRTGDGDGTDPAVKNPYIQMVLGTDYTFYNGVTINVQYFKEFITGIDSDGERSLEEGIISRLGLGLPLRQVLTSRLGRDFGESEQHSLQLFAIVDLDNRGYILQPKIKLSPEDALAFELGSNLYGGKSASLFGRFGRNDELYVKGIYSF